ncbi:MAG: hypothetical protein ACLFQ8_00665 [Candidatus Aenigmatarchaeota archaeon]
MDYSSILEKLDEFADKACKYNYFFDADLGGPLYPVDDLLISEKYYSSNEDS